MTPSAGSEPTSPVPRQDAPLGPLGLTGDPFRPAPSAGRSRRRVGRLGVPLVLGGGALLLGGCNVPTFGAFRGSTVQGHDEFKLWFGTTVAGLVVAAIVWGLIFWSLARYRKRRGDNSIPRQFSTNHILEVVYTTIPVIIVAVLFYFTVVTENEIDAVSSHPAEIVHVLAYRWGWRFTYADSSNRPQGVVIQTTAEPSYYARAATSKEYPQMVLPEGETVRIVLTTNDVIHGFYVPAFNFSRYAQSGVTNRFDFTPTELGVFRGQCTQYCGLYHAEMLFSVRVVSATSFRSWLSAEQTTQAAAS